MAGAYSCVVFVTVRMVYHAMSFYMVDLPLSYIIYI